MPSGRSSDRDRRRRGDTSSSRRADRARRTGSRGTTASSRDTTATPRARSAGQKTARAGARSSTGGAFKLSSTRRAAVLAMVVCAMALSVSVPLRTYLSQGEELSAQQQQQEQLSAQVEELEQRKKKLSDPAQVEAEARKRLGYVRPGETPYIVQVPEQQPAERPAEDETVEQSPWYEELWQSLTGNGS